MTFSVLVLMMLITVGIVMISIAGGCFQGTVLIVLVAVTGMMLVIGTAVVRLFVAVLSTGRAFLGRAISVFVMIVKKITDFFHGHTV